MSQNLARHLQNVAELMPCVRHGVGMVGPASFKIATIRLSVNREVFMEISPRQCKRIFQFWRPRFSKNIAVHDTYDGNLTR
jgi:hypothetical protein